MIGSETSAVKLLHRSSCTKSSLPFLLLLLLCALSCTSAFANPVDPTKPNRTLCYIPILADIQTVLHGQFTIKYYTNASSARTNYNEINWFWRFVGNPETNAKNTVLAWAPVAENGGCDVLLGPPYSYLSIAISPLVEIPWISTSATSTELSDKESHKYFSRVIPTDEVGSRSVAAMMLRFGWRQTNILCVEEPYGRSVATGLSEAMTNAGGFVEVSRCLEQSASAERLQPVIDSFLASSTRLVFIAGLPDTTLFRNFKVMAREQGLHEKLIFFFSEAFCSGGDRTYTDIAGSFCATYTSNEAVMDPFLSEYNQRDTSDVAATLEELGYGANITLTGVTDIYSVLAHDATKHAMSALTAHHINNSTEPLLSYIRGHTTPNTGTGSVSMDTRGDRRSIPMVVFNAQPHVPQPEVRFSRVESDLRVVFDTPMSSDPDTIPSLFFLGQMRTDPPSAASVTEQTASSGNEILLIIVVSVSSVVGLFAVLGFVLFVLQKPKTRNNNLAPREGEFPIVFTDIQNSTGLWAREPEVMSREVERHHVLIRSLIERHKGYEVKTVGDSFMVVFSSCDAAAKFGIDVQRVFYEGECSPRIDECYGALCDASMNQEYNRIWHGLRIRVGIHIGEPKVVFDQVTQGYDYYGSVVNTAARVEAVGHGGMVLCSGAMLACLSSSALANCDMLDFGEQELRGLDQPIQLVQLSPTQFSGRSFPPLRLDIKFEVQSQYHESQPSEAEDTDVEVTSVSSPVRAHGSTTVVHRYARRWINEGHPDMSFEKATRMMAKNLHLFRTALSVAPPSYRHKTLVFLAEKWRLRGEIGGGTKASNTELLMGIVYKTLKAEDATTQWMTGMNSVTSVQRRMDSSEENPFAWEEQHPPVAVHKQQSGSSTFQPWSVLGADHSVS